MIDLSLYFDKADSRYAHIESIKNLMENLTTALKLDVKFKGKCLYSAILHDIGYSKKVSKTNFHPYDGYMFCRENNIDISIAKVILLHSGSTVEMLMKNLSLNNLYFETIRSLNDEEQLMLELLTFCDMRVDSHGNEVTLWQRAAEIEARYDTDSVIMKHILANMPYYLCIDRKYSDYI
jgi:HD superfamily phosphodiesterase